MGNHVTSLDKPRDSTSIFKTLPDKLDSKRHSPSTLKHLHLASFLFGAFGSKKKKSHKNM